MFPATAWDGAEARHWTVMGRLRERQAQLRNRAIQARRRMNERETRSDLPEVAWAGAERDRDQAQWNGSPTVVALLFGHPDSSALRMLDARGEYFDFRTGDTWDLFFPGYFRSNFDQRAEEGAGSRPIGERLRVWKELTGKTADELWDEFMATLKQ